MRERITSRANPLIGRIRKLRSSRGYRREEGCFLGEGPKLLEEALKWGAEIEAVLCEDGFPLPELPLSVRVVEGPRDLVAAAADTQTPQGVVFVCSTPSTALPEALEGERFLVLDGVQDPGNVGTIWRSADAFGADALLMCSGCADPWSPKAIRATMGAVFRLPVYECTLPEAAERLRAQGVPLYAAALDDRASDLRTLDLRRAAAIVGSEGRGVSPKALEVCGGTVKIPMRARCESLNAAVAAAVILWEMSRDRAEW